MNWQSTLAAKRLSLRGRVAVGRWIGRVLILGRNRPGTRAPSTSTACRGEPLGKHRSASLQPKPRRRIAPEVNRVGRQNPAAIGRRGRSIGAVTWRSKRSLPVLPQPPRRQRASAVVLALRRVAQAAAAESAPALRPREASACRCAAGRRSPRRCGRRSRNCWTWRPATRADRGWLGV